MFPFVKFPDEDVLLGPEMKSTGEVMGVGEGFGTAFAKAFIGAGNKLPLEGTVFFSVNDKDKTDAIHIAKELHELDFQSSQRKERRAI